VAVVSAVAQIVSENVALLRKDALITEESP